MKIKASKTVLKAMHRTEDQIEMQTYKGTGNGGQHRNKTETGVRLIDLVTGIRAESCEEKSQLANKKKAKEKLVRQLQAHYEKQELELRAKENYLDLSRTVRTYDEKHGVVDHRLNGEVFSFERVINGKDLRKIIERVLEEEVNKNLNR